MCTCISRQLCPRMDLEVLTDAPNIGRKGETEATSGTDETWRSIANPTRTLQLTLTWSRMTLRHRVRDGRPEHTTSGN